MSERDRCAPESGRYPAKWSWFVGWFNLVGQVAVTAGIDFGLATFATALLNLTTHDPDMQNAYSEQASVEVERQIGGAGTVSAGYTYIKGIRLMMAINQNVPSCVAAGTNNGCRPNPQNLRARGTTQPTAV